jgi:POT family proton-dependent oligopeptide transporter
MSSENQENTSVDSIKQLGLVAAVSSLGYVFWVVGGMEMIERLAYYGVKAVAALYAKDPVSKGGLGINMEDFGNILLVWALIQSIVPVFTGGLSDRYGYKETIFASTAVKIVGYLVMAFMPSYSGFMFGAVILAAGTAIFKPGIQGTLVNCTRPENSSMAWGVFYQTVNIGGFLGPILAGKMRLLAWENVFFACAAIISLNFFMLLLYKEPGKEERLRRAQERADSGEEQENLFEDSLNELRKPALWLYLVIFSGFWFMFNALFDVLPVHIDEWVNSSDIVNSIFGEGGATSGSFWGSVLVLNKEGTHILPEGLLNINAGLIMLTCFAFAWLSGLMKATNSMVAGTLLATASLFLIGSATTGWVMAGVICIFSVGEMLSSPKFSEFIGNMAPPDKKAMYLGFSQIPLAVGWTLEGKLGPMLYDMYGSKERISRAELDKMGLPIDLQTLPEGEAFTKLVEASGKSAEVLTAQLHAANDIHMVWWIMGVVGIISAIGIYMYGRWLVSMKDQPAAR